MIEQFFLQHVEGTKPASKYVKVSKYGVICGSYFPIFGPHTEIYSVNKKNDRNSSTFEHFSRSEISSKPCF